MAIDFFFTEINITLRERTRLKQFIQEIFKTNRTNLKSLTYIFCTDDYLLEINKKFLKHDFYTDIITFDLSEKRQIVEGEIYISIERVKENATNLGTTLKNELHRVIFHGVLHLCGFKDKTTKDKEKMTMEENQCLRRYFS